MKEAQQRTKEIEVTFRKQLNERHEDLCETTTQLVMWYNKLCVRCLQLQRVRQAHHILRKVQSVLQPKTQKMKVLQEVVPHSVKKQLWSVTLNNHSCLALFSGQLHQALNYVERAHRLAPDSAVTLLNKSVILLRLGRNSDALRTCSQAMQLLSFNAGEQAAEIEDIRKVVSLYHQMAISKEKNPSSPLLQTTSRTLHRFAFALSDKQLGWDNPITQAVSRYVHPLPPIFEHTPGPDAKPEEITTESATDPWLHQTVRRLSKVLLSDDALSTTDKAEVPPNSGRRRSSTFSSRSKASVGGTHLPIPPSILSMVRGATQQQRKLEGSSGMEVVDTKAPPPTTITTIGFLPPIPVPPRVSNHHHHHHHLNNPQSQSIRKHYCALEKAEPPPPTEQYNSDDDPRHSIAGSFDYILPGSENLEEEYKMALDFPSRGSNGTSSFSMHPSFTDHVDLSDHRLPQFPMVPAPSSSHPNSYHGNLNYPPQYDSVGTTYGSSGTLPQQSLHKSPANRGNQRGSDYPSYNQTIPYPPVAVNPALSSQPPPRSQQQQYQQQPQQHLQQQQQPQQYQPQQHQQQQQQHQQQQQQSQQQQYQQQPQQYQQQQHPQQRQQQPQQYQQQQQQHPQPQQQQQQQQHAYVQQPYDVQPQTYTFPPNNNSNSNPPVGGNRGVLPPTTTTNGRAVGHNGQLQQRPVGHVVSTEGMTMPHIISPSKYSAPQPPHRQPASPNPRHANKAQHNLVTPHQQQQQQQQQYITPYGQPHEPPLLGPASSPNMLPYPPILPASEVPTVPTLNPHQQFPHNSIGERQQRGVVQTDGGGTTTLPSLGYHNNNVQSPSYQAHAAEPSNRKYIASNSTVDNVGMNGYNVVDHPHLYATDLISGHNVDPFNSPLVGNQPTAAATVAVVGNNVTLDSSGEGQIQTTSPLEPPYSSGSPTKGGSTSYGATGASKLVGPLKDSLSSVLAGSPTSDLLHSYSMQFPLEDSSGEDDNRTLSGEEVQPAPAEGAKPEVDSPIEHN